MRVRARGKWCLLSGQAVAMLVLGGCFLIGGAAGALFSGSARGEGAELLRSYLTDYLSLAAQGELERPFFPLLWEQMRYFLAAILLGVSALGVVGLPILFGVRGFLFSFSSGCFVRVFGGIGLLPALILFGIPALLWAPGLFLCGSMGLSSAWNLLRSGRREGRIAAPAYRPRMGLCALLFLGCGAVEYGVVPTLLGAAARAVL